MQFKLPLCHLAFALCFFTLASAADLYPLAIGNTWHFRSLANSDTTDMYLKVVQRREVPGQGLTFVQQALITTKGNSKAMETVEYHRWKQDGFLFTLMRSAKGHALTSELLLDPADSSWQFDKTGSKARMSLVGDTTISGKSYSGVWAVDVETSGGEAISRTLYMSGRGPISIEEWRNGVHVKWYLLNSKIQ